MCYSYSCSKGAFAGVSIEGSLLTTRSDVNLNFYGETPSEGRLPLAVAFHDTPASWKPTLQFGRNAIRCCKLGMPSRPS